MSSPGKLPQDEARALAPHVARLSSLLTKDRESLPAVYLKDAGLRTAYVRYYLPPNMKKVSLALAELSLHPDRLLARDRLRILDLGSGPGTALLGVLAFFARRTERPQLDCVAVDRVVENLRTAEELFGSYRTNKGLSASLKTLRADLEAAEQLAEEPFDLIILSNVLNELFPFDEDRLGKRLRVLQNILGRLLVPEGSCIIIEPALRTTSRELLEVRDQLLEQDFHIYSPCLIGTRGPALENPRDWCHEDVPWDAPALIKEIDRLTGLRKDSLKFSHLVLRKDYRSLVDLFGPDSFRVVSEPLVTKGKIEFYLCGLGGRKLVTRLDKDRSSANQYFEVLQRGAIVSFEQLVDEKTRYKVEPHTTVIIHRHEP